MAGHNESRRCSRDTYPESYITKYTSKQKLNRVAGRPAKADLWSVGCILFELVNGRQVRFRTQPQNSCACMFSTLDLNPKEVARLL